MSAEAKLEIPQKPEFTQKGEPNFNYTKTPNALVDELIAKGKLAMGVECIILLVIQRHTWGAEGKPEYFRASLSEIARACRVTPPGVAFALKRLETAGIIDSIPKGAIGANEKRGYRLTPENWHKVKVYKDPNAVKPEKPKDAQPAVGFDADQPRVVALKPNRDKTVNIPITAQAPGEFDFPIRLLNEVDLSLAFALVLTKVGLDVIARWPAAAGGTKGEHKADAGDDGKKRTKSELVQSVLYSYPSQVIENKQPQIAGAYNSYFSKIFQNELGKPLDQPFLKQLVEASGGAPVNYFDAPLARLRKRGILRKDNPKNASGLILRIAEKEVRKLWETRRKEHEADESRKAKEATDKAAARRKEIEEEFQAHMTRAAGEE